MTHGPSIEVGRGAGARRVRRAAFVLATLALGVSGPGGASAEHGDTPTGETMRGPLLGDEYRVVVDDEGTKSLVGPDGRRYASAGEIADAESARCEPLRRVLMGDLADLALDAGRSGEIVAVTILFREQPAHEAGLAARERHGGELRTLVARGRSILDRIAPLRSATAGAGVVRVRDVLEEERRLLTDAEVEELRSVRAEVARTAAAMRREVLEAAVPRVDASQAGVREFVESSAGARVHSRSVILSTLTADVPAGLLETLVTRFPEVARVERILSLDCTLDTSVDTIGADDWWSAGYQGTSSERVAIIDTGIDPQHPALKSNLASAAVFHASARFASNYSSSESPTNPDDLHSHGTHVGGIVASADSTYTGVAPGADLLNVKAGFLTTTGGGSFYSSDIMLGGDWAASNGATAMNASLGSSSSDTSGSSILSLYFDAVVHAAGIPVAISSGNSGPNSSTVGVPGDAFNILSVGAFDDGSSYGSAYFPIASFSSRGPTSDGRRKPDLCAPGVSTTSCWAGWETSGDFVAFSGTSMAAPHVAGALALLADYSTSWQPHGAKALLVATGAHDAVFNTAPNDAHGWGALALGNAFLCRASVFEGQHASSGNRAVFLRTGSLAAGAAVALAWDRPVSVSGGSGGSTSFAYDPLLDLDLTVFDESNGALRGYSESALNSVEYVAAGAATSSPVVKVLRLGSFSAGLTEQSWSVAAESTSSTTEVDPPALTSTFQPAPSVVAGGTQFDVTVDVANSGGLRAHEIAVTLTLPAGYSLVSGSAQRFITSIAAGGKGSVTWTVRSATSGSGTKSFSVGTQSVSYEEIFNAATVTLDHVLDVDPPTGTVVVAGGAEYTRVRPLTAAFDASDAHSGLAAFRVRDAANVWGPWTAYQTSSDVTLSASQGMHSVEAQFMDAVGNVSAAASDSIVFDDVAPAGGLSIAGGAAWTNAAAVTLGPSASDATSGVAEMQFSDDGAAWSAAAAFAASATWTLPGSDGTKTVFARYVDRAGNVSSAASDSIGLDRAAPTGSLTIADGATWTSAADVALTTSAADSGSGVVQMEFSDDATSWRPRETFATSGSWTLGGTDGTRTVLARFVDAAGNVSEAVSDTIGLDRASPSGSVTIAGGAFWSNTADVALALTASDATSGVDSFRISGDGQTWADWSAYATGAPWTLAGADGSSSVYVQFRDAAGNVSSAVSDGIGLDREAPQGSVEIDGGAAWTRSTDVAAALSASDATSGVSRMRFSLDGSQWSAWQAYTTTAARTLGGPDGTNRVHVQFEDVAGNVSAAASDAIGLDRVAPTAGLQIAGGSAWSATADVSVGPSSDDATSGVSEMQFSDDGAAWDAWTAFGPTAARTLPGPDGTNAVHVRFRDAAGNVSDPASDTIGLDRVAPTGTIRLSAGALYLAPGRRLEADLTSADAAEGSGVAEFSWSHDDGATWSPWTAASPGIVDVGIPPVADAMHAVLGRFRDVAGNVSATTSAAIHVLDPVPQDATVVARLAGSFDEGSDVDAYRFELQAGDRLDARLSVKPALRGTEFTADVDLFGPDGSQVVTGRHPSASRRAGITRYQAPATGTYTLVLRASGDGVPGGAAYTLTSVVRPARAPRIAGSSAALPVVIEFDASAGRGLSGTVRTPSPFTGRIDGPDASSAADLSGRLRRGVFKIARTVLAQGSGRYSLTLTAPEGAPAGVTKWSLSLSPARRARRGSEAPSVE